MFMSYENNKTSDARILDLSNKINLKRTDKYIALSNLSIYYTCEDIKKSSKNSKFKISAPKWNKQILRLIRVYKKTWN